MAYQALYRAWRPDSFSNVVGQKPIIATLTHQIETGHIAHAYLFCGSRGTGKTSTAKVMAKAINCEHPLPGAEPCGTCDSCRSLAEDNNMDVMEIDAASNNSVEEVRALRERIVYPPSVGKYKVYIIDEVHMLSTGAFNALLKTLEEPPAHAVFILATTEPQKLPATILSRCQRYDFKRIAAGDIISRLQTILHGIHREADEEALEIIARSSEGGMRDAISLLDMCLSYEDGTVTASLVREALGASDKSFLFDFVGSLLAGNASDALVDISKVIEEGRDPSVFLKEVIGHMRCLMLAGLMPAERLADLLETTTEDAQQYISQASTVPQSMILRRMDLFMGAEADLRWASQARSVLELATVRACHPEAENGEDALSERVHKLENAMEQGIVLARDSREEKAGNAASAGKKEKVKDKDKDKSATSEVVQPKVSQEVQEMWDKALQLLENEPDIGSKKALLMKCAIVGFENDTLHLQLERSKLILINLLKRPAYVAILEKALTTVAGKPTHIQFSVEEIKRKTETFPGADSTNAFDKVYETFGRDKVEMVNVDEMVPIE